MKKGAPGFVRLLLRLLMVLVGLVVFAGAAFYLHLRSSLPVLDGELALPGLAENVEIVRDADGIPTLRGQSRKDLAAALGFLHAQERFFQMDLLRRAGAGELSALLGASMLSVDRELRLHRARHRAERSLAAADDWDRSLLEAYSQGVNRGLEALDARPFEYLVLRVDPIPWQPVDTLLVVQAMFVDLQDETGRRESAYGVLHDVLPPELANFLDPGGTSWDAPLRGEPVQQVPCPGPEVYDLRNRPPAAPERAAWRAYRPDDDPVLGSNNWAVSGHQTESGLPLLANDMHLALRVPTIWYRASLVWPLGGEPWQVTGVTLPGTPATVVGSNSKVAWGFTNSYGDWSDLVVVDVDPDAPEDRYLTAEGSRAFEAHEEILEVAHGESEVLEVRETIWGPIVDEDHLGRPRALRWTAHLVGGIDLGLVEVETARHLEDAMTAANQAGVPAQNFVVADAEGRIGWTILGRIPRRFGHDGHLPTSWADGERGWDGWLAVDEVPRIVDPPDGRVWTANARVVDGEDLRLVGDGDYALGARARQIRDALFELEKSTEDDHLALQLDDRALFLERWRQLFLDTLDAAALEGEPRRTELAEVVKTTWTGRASVDSAAYRLVRAFRLYLGEDVLASLLRDCAAADERLVGFQPRQWEGPVWKLLEERPRHLLDPRYETWDEQILASVDRMLEYFGDGALAERTWGERNTARIVHPLAAFLPFSSYWLNATAEPLAGDAKMPRAQGPSFGASERMVVSPGREDEGILQMPVGQSGHPLSPYYLAGHEAWARGERSPFLPGPPAYRLVLKPKTVP